jgi:hypothetical protein
MPINSNIAIMPEIANREKPEGGDAEPPRQFGLVLRQQHQTRGDGGDQHRRDNPAHGRGEVGRKDHAHRNPAAEHQKSRRDQGHQARHIIAHRKGDREHRQTGKSEVSDRLIAGRSIP